MNKRQDSRWPRVHIWLRGAALLSADAGSSLLRRPWHAVGMIVGVLLGVASATAAIVIADTQETQIGLRFDLQRSTHVVIRADAPTSAGFPQPQVKLVAGLGPVREVGEFSTWSDQEPITRSVASATVPAPVIVADVDGLAASGSRVTAGASANLLANRSGTALAWIGKQLANELHVAPKRGEHPTDAQVVVAGYVFSVAGVLSNDSGFEYVESSVVLSRRTALETLGGNGTNVRLLAHVRPGAAKAVSLYAIRTVDPGDQLMLVDQTPDDGTKLVGSVGSDLRRVGTALGLVVGLVGMVAVSNTLTMAVHHRLRELGLRSAIGWSRLKVGLLVLTESGIAGLTAGLAGAAVGLGAADLWCWIQGWTLTVPPLLPATVTAAGVAASLLGGVIPAFRAATISPLNAMRS